MKRPKEFKQLLIRIRDKSSQRAKELAHDENPIVKDIRLQYETRMDMADAVLDFMLGDPVPLRVLAE